MNETTHSPEDGWLRWNDREYRIEARPKGRKRFRVAKRIDYGNGYYVWAKERYFRTREDAQAGLSAWVAEDQASVWRSDTNVLTALPVPLTSREHAHVLALWNRGDHDAFEALVSFIERRTRDER